MKNIYKLILMILPLVIFSGCFSDTNVFVADEVSICDPDNSSMCVGVDNDNLQVQLQDQFTPIVDFHLINVEGNVTLNQSTITNNRTVILNTGHSVMIGDVINFYEEGLFSQEDVINVTVNTITLTNPMDRVYSTSALLQFGSANMAVDGSVTPISFEICPQPGFNTTWDITRFTVVAQAPGAMDSSMMCNILGGVERGMLVRERNGDFFNIFNWRTNGQFAEHAFDIAYDDRATGQGEFFFRGRRSFSGQEKNGVVVRLTGLNNECLEILVQDNLLLCDAYVATGQGHRTN